MGTDPAKPRARFQFSPQTIAIAGSLLAILCWLTYAVCETRPWISAGYDSARYPLAVIASYAVEGDSMVIEYRMPVAFKVTLDHQLMQQKPYKTLRSETCDVIPSRYNVLRGNYVLLRATRGKQLSIVSDEQSALISPWINPDALHIEWLPRGVEGGVYGDGVGSGLITLGSDANRTETIMFEALSDGLRDWLKSKPQQ